MARKVGRNINSAHPDPENSKGYFSDELKEQFRLTIKNAEPQLYSASSKESQSVEMALKRREDIKNQGMLQDITLKKITLAVLFLFLALETVTIFIYAFFQATGVFGFHLEEWSFKLLLSATILQITIMLQVAVRHLFPV